ncbi:unnamed protein product [Clonostachys solani]|uniref:Tetrahydroxynaphthalene reductase n=1 Tax=Clonostachys solani TaxID=160281 RepID=A0A9P0ER15_9HYPO|nr:unnamed protein product [Clonostachys solani]
MPSTTRHQFQSLQGRVAVVTGSGRGIGKGIALELASRGANVVVNYANSTAAAESVVAEIKAMGPDAIAVKADVSDVEQIKDLFKKAYDKFGHIDIVASNSGIESFDRSVDLTPEHFDKVFNINTRGQFFVAVEGYKYMIKTENRSAAGGRIILTSSIAAGVMGVYDHALYEGSKSAVEGLTRSLATDFGAEGITVNAIAPGGVVSDMSAEVAWRYIPGADSSWPQEKIVASLASASPMKRAAYPKDIAKTVAMLAGDDSGWITGQTILCAGGASV